MLTDGAIRKECETNGVAVDPGSSKNDMIRALAQHREKADSKTYLTDGTSHAAPASQRGESCSALENYALYCCGVRCSLSSINRVLQVDPTIMLVMVHVI